MIQLESFHEFEIGSIYMTLKFSSQAIRFLTHPKLLESSLEQKVTPTCLKIALIELL